MTCHLSKLGSTPALVKESGRDERKAGRDPPDRAIVNTFREARAVEHVDAMTEWRRDGRVDLDDEIISRPL